MCIHAPMVGAVHVDHKCFEWVACSAVSVFEMTSRIMSCAPDFSMSLGAGAGDGDPADDFKHDESDSYINLDSLIDFYDSLGMDEPLFELSFMPCVRNLIPSILCKSCFFQFCELAFP